MCHMHMPVDYHVWGAMLELYWIHIPKVTNVMLSWMTILWTIRNDLLRSLLIRQCIIFVQQMLIVCCCNLWAVTLWTLCLNNEWVIDSWYSSLKHLSCWWKALQNLICYLWIFNLYFHLKKWTVKFKLLYLLSHVLFQ